MTSPGRCHRGRQEIQQPLAAIVAIVVASGRVSSYFGWRRWFESITIIDFVVRRSSSSSSSSCSCTACDNNHIRIGGKAPRRRRREPSHSDCWSNSMNEWTNQWINQSINSQQWFQSEALDRTGHAICNNNIYILQMIQHYFVLYSCCCCSSRSVLLMVSSSCIQSPMIEWYSTEPNRTELKNAQINSEGQNREKHNVDCRQLHRNV